MCAAWSPTKDLAVSSHLDFTISIARCDMNNVKNTRMAVNKPRNAQETDPARKATRKAWK